MAYTDELDPLLALEQELRRKIALRLAEEAGAPAGEMPSEHQMPAAEEAIAAWRQDGEEEHDMRAFRPLGPLQQLLAEHDQICERIADVRDRRLS